MERLTKREYGEITYSKNRDIMCSSFCNSCSVGTGNCNTVKAMVEKLAEYEDLEEQGRLLALPCGVGKYEKRLVDLDKAMDESTLCDWYITSVSLKDEPVWTDRHIEELLNDFYVIPKD